MAKLQSVKTVRFSRKELQRLARLSRPRKPPSILLSALAGFAVGIVILFLLRLL